MKFIKNNIKLIIGFIIGVILAGGVVYAVTSANQINYTTSKNGEIQTVEDALNDLYENSKFSIPSVVWNAGHTGWVYGYIDLPDLTNYKTLTIDSITLTGGTFQYAKLMKNGEILHNFTLSNSVQTLDLSSYSGTGYVIYFHANSMGNDYKELRLTNLVLK